ncbi:helix-turn-helix transcriptional regulator, partial [Streptomyces sp. T-3]|nr:helix-turn-helix transcriptional regulator [Streptomyces sp. T-3]
PDPTGLGNLLPTLAWVAAMQGRHADAATLSGAAAGIRRGVSPFLLDDPEMLALDRKFCKRAEQALGKEEFDRLHAQGELLGLRPAVAFALGEPLDPAPEAPGLQAPLLATLTRREREVAALVHQGLSNREIAERLVISKRTADAHVEHILAKLGIASRGEIAALVRAENDRSRT